MAIETCFKNIKFTISIEPPSQIGPKVMKASTIFLFAVFFSGPAHAYLDPGTGSIILQAIVGTIAGGLVVIKLYWYRIKNLFKKQIPEEPPDGENN
jgi:hypothetical protein